MLLTSASTSQALILTYAKFMEKVYSDDVNIEMLTTKMEIFKVLLKDGDLFCV